jgi:hypothetical protein
MPGFRFSGLCQRFISFQPSRVLTLLLLVPHSVAEHCFKSLYHFQDAEMDFSLQRCNLVEAFLFTCVVKILRVCVRTRGGSAACRRVT